MDAAPPRLARLATLYALALAFAFHTIDASRRFLRTIDGTVEYDGTFVSQPKEHHSRFLLGIFTHNSKQSDIDLREAIKMTYLQHEPEKGRICGLDDVLEKKIDIEPCRIVYAFVFGGNGIIEPGSAPKERTNDTSTPELLVDRNYMSTDLLASRGAHSVIMNITEQNQEEGKVPTWFRYCWLLLNERGWLDGRNSEGFVVDYVGRMDSDLLLFPNKFWQWVELVQNRSQNLLPYPNNTRTFGGISAGKRIAGFPKHDHAHLMTSPIFMPGSMEILSPDVADYVTSPSKWKHWVGNETKYQHFHSDPSLPHEDLQLANHVFRYSEYLKVQAHAEGLEQSPVFNPPDAQDTKKYGIRVAGKREENIGAWAHPIKNHERMKSVWNREQARSRQQAAG